MANPVHKTNELLNYDNEEKIFNTGRVNFRRRNDGAQIAIGKA